MNGVTAQYVRSILDFDPDTGVFSWKDRPRSDFSTPQAYGAWRARCYGREPGSSCAPYKYRQISIKGRFYGSHRIAWLYVYGSWPIGHIDHINGDCSDNRISNLRDVTNADNRRNAGLPTTNTSGAIGVYKMPSGKWEARLQKNGKTIHLGRFSDKNAAIRERQKAAIAAGFHPNHGLRPSIPMGDS